MEHMLTYATADWLELRFETNRRPLTSRKFICSFRAEQAKNNAKVDQFEVELDAAMRSAYSMLDQLLDLQSDIRRMDDVIFPNLRIVVEESYNDCYHQAPCMAVPDCAFPVPSGESCHDIAQRAAEADLEGDILNPLQSGVYIIKPSGLQFKSVQCLMEPNGVGQTVIQNRFNGEQSFSLNWNDYRNGFGEAIHANKERCPLGEYWIGNEYIYQLQKRRSVSLKVQSEIFAG